MKRNKNAKSQSLKNNFSSVCVVKAKECFCLWFLLNLLCFIERKNKEPNQIDQEKPIRATSKIYKKRVWPKKQRLTCIKNRIKI